jgi:hypothetical protein
MNRSYRILLPLVVTVALGACDGRGPTQPTSAPLSATASGQTFTVAGVVTDEHGERVAEAVVTMGYWVDGRVHFQSVSADARGRYAIRFTADPSTSGFVARAQVAAEGYEDYWRSITLVASGATVNQDFRLLPITRVTAGESIGLSVPPDVGECRGWVAAACAIVRVAVPQTGSLRVEAIPTDPGDAIPPVEVCCVRGGEVYGNPISVPVTAGIELEVKVGLPRGSTTTRSFRVGTAFDASR